MTVLPFICLGVGIFLGSFVKLARLAEIAEKVSTIALIVLMLAIGIGIGLDQQIISQFGKIGLNCIVIALSTIAFSVAFTVICEKTILPLEQIDNELKNQNVSLEDTLQSDNKDEKKMSHLVWIMPGSIIFGLFIGFFFSTYLNQRPIDKIFTVSLIILYICVGVSQGQNREVFRFIRILGLKVLCIPAAILLGSVVGGVFAAIILKIPFYISVAAAGGMSFYSITGAYMTQTFGLAAGTYGFIVNVLREFFTVLLMPILIKISLGSPIAGGAAGDMDTMLAPVTKFVGVRLGLVTLITGTVLTFIVPFLLPIISYLFHF